MPQRLLFFWCSQINITWTASSGWASGPTCRPLSSQPFSQQRWQGSLGSESPSKQSCGIAAKECAGRALRVQTLCPCPYTRTEGTPCTPPSSHRQTLLCSPCWGSAHLAKSGGHNYSTSLWVPETMGCTCIEKRRANWLAWLPRGDYVTAESTTAC